METKWELYSDALATKTDEHLPALNAALVELDGMIFSKEFCSEGGFSYDDIDLWLAPHTCVHPNPKLAHTHTSATHTSLHLHAHPRPHVLLDK